MLAWYSDSSTSRAFRLSRKYKSLLIWKEYCSAWQPSCNEAAISATVLPTYIPPYREKEAKGYKELLTLQIPPLQNAQRSLGRVEEILSSAMTDLGESSAESPPDGALLGSAFLAVASLESVGGAVALGTMETRGDSFGAACWLSGCGSSPVLGPRVPSTKRLQGQSIMSG